MRRPRRVLAAGVVAGIAIGVAHPAARAEPREVRAPSIVGGAPGVPRSLRALMVTARGATPANGRWRLSMAGPVPSEIARRRAVDPELTRRLMSVKLSLDPTPAAALAAPRLDDRIWLALPERPAWTFDPPIMLEVPRFPTGGAGLAIKFRY